MSPATKQDVQAMLDTARNRLFERVVCKQDIQALLDCMKTLLSVHQQNQQFLKQAEYQRLQLIRRMSAIEARLNQVEQHMRFSQEALNKFAQQQARPQKVFFQPSNQDEQQLPGYGQYVYRPG